MSSWAAGFAEDGLICVRHRDPREPHRPACLAPNHQVSSPCAAMRLFGFMSCALWEADFMRPFGMGMCAATGQCSSCGKPSSTRYASTALSQIDISTHACIYACADSPIHTFGSMPQSSFDPLAERLDTRCPAAAWDALNDAVRTLHRMTRQCLESNRRRRIQARGSCMRASIACVRVCWCAYACVRVCWQRVPVRDTERACLAHVLVCAQMYPYL